MDQSTRRAQLIAFAFTALAGTLLHFLFDWSGQAPPVGAVSAVNESVWEHMKLLFLPMLTAALVQSLLPVGQRRDFWCIKLRGILLGLFLIPALYYTYTGALGRRFTWLDISIYYIAVAAAYLTETRQLRAEPKRSCPTTAAALTLAAIALAFLVFTYFPPRLPIFLDPVTGSYGIPQ